VLLPVNGANTTKAEPLNVLSISRDGGRRTELRHREAGLPVSTAVTAHPPQTSRLCTVLLVDDDGLIRMAAADTLKDLGHHVIEAPSGTRALEILRAGAAVDMVMTDQAMPGMTGTQLAAAIREAWPDLPVVIATGYPELTEGSNLDLPRLNKPYGQDELTAVIVRLMRARAKPTP
jgi:CheY-like chemotaxis protein